MEKQTIIQRILHAPPVFFPVAVLFHFFLLIYGFIGIDNEFSYNWPTLLWYVVAFVLSVFCLLLKRWAAIAYVTLTAIGLLLRYVLPVGIFWKDVGATLLPFDVLMCFFLLFFYKRFR